MKKNLKNVVDIVIATNGLSYLGCVIASDANIDKEVDNGLAKANSAFGRLYKRVWNNKNQKKDTKISVYKAVVLDHSRV